VRYDKHCSYVLRRGSSRQGLRRGGLMQNTAEAPHIRTSGRRHSIVSYILTALVGSLIGIIVILTVFPQLFNVQPRNSPPRSSVVSTVPLKTVGQPVPQEVLIAANNETTSSRRTAIVSAVERASPAVVSIVATFKVQQRGYSRLSEDPFFGDFLVPRIYARVVPSTGSGVIINDKGYIITNGHVVQSGKVSAQRIRAVLTDGRSLECALVGYDDMSDLAVLRIEGQNFPVAPLGRSSEVLVGEWAIAIGNPLGLAIDDAKPAVTVGVVSAVGRDFSRRESDSQAVYRDMIQTDASINPGNSGGPLVNALGEVIGINTFIISEGGGSEGIGFAIPIDRVVRVVDELIQFGQLRRGWTGLTVIDITAFLAEELNIQDRKGVLVYEIDKESPADRANIHVMDVIRRINGEPIMNRSDAREALYGSLVGDAVELSIERNGQAMTVVLRIAER
jgi:serine protease Do